MSLTVVFDDTYDVPAALQALVCIEHFGDLVFQRRSRTEAMRSVTAKANLRMITLRTAEERQALIEHLREENPDHLYLHCPAHLIAVSDDEELATFLKQIGYSPTALFMPLGGRRDWRGWTLASTLLFRRLLMKQDKGDLASFFERHGNSLAEVGARVRLIDVSDERTLASFLSGQFDTRHFNHIEEHDYTVVKRSRDRAKMKREYEFYRLIPPAMQMFLVQPFEFADDGHTASYCMERISVPDMALQWVHGAFQAPEFERFLKQFFYFLGVRPARQAGKAETRKIQDDLYVGKVHSRIAALKELPAYRALAPLLERGVGGIDALVARYMKAFERVRGRLPANRLVAGHGDPCFSNILYSKTSQLLKLIDPRGAESEDDLYTDPYYDVAKLSHSVLGAYDFINLDKFEITVNKELHLRLELDGSPPDWAGMTFMSLLAEAGYEIRAVRTCEASLFISMLPLHIDRPRKVLGFAIRAAQILDELEHA